MNRWIPGAVIVLAAWIAAGCGSTINRQIGQATPSPPERNTTLLAGVGKADITPRPGMPTAGYATNGNYGMGFRTRLYARVIYLKPVNGRPVALVQCDLLSGSEIVLRRLAEVLPKETGLDLGGIMMSGTHTHSGPGNLFGSDFYVKHASNAKGLDPEFFDFVTNQVARAIVDAYNDRRPARIATGSTEAYGFTRNRSISAYRANKNADAEKAKDIRKAVNAGMHMVRVDCLDETSGAYKPAGALTSFSIHGTSVPSENTLYNADVFAYMERELEWEMARKHGATKFVHAVVNGTHADNAPDCDGKCKGYKDARRLGLGLGRKAIELFDSLAGELSAGAEVRSAIREIDYYRTSAIDGIGICDPPRVGTTLTAGAEDGGPTPMLSRLPFFKEGSHRWIFTGGCQGNKRILLGLAQGIFLPRDEFPHVITYQAIRLGNMVLLPLPYELTLESGRRVVEACRKSAREGGMGADTRFVVVSVSNGYTGYCTTPEEYGVQRYEGGHTLYGPNTGPFIAAQAAKLVGDMARNGELRDLEVERTFQLTLKTYYTEYDAPKGGRAAIAQPSQCKAEGEEGCWSFRWTDVPPPLIDLHKRLVSIEYSEDRTKWLPLEERGIRVDDDGYDLSVAFTKEITAARLGVYETRWYNPERNEARWYRFRIEPRQGQEVFFSKAFQ
ncbi:MAG: neutral/alkaline non-lysosomal ceramidase N-terminal domain-containing protein [bacterium]|jgi:neutral ceramidase